MARAYSKAEGMMLPVGFRVAERLRLVDGVAVEGEGGGQAHALVVPG